MWILWLNSGNEMLKEVMIMLSASEALKKLKEGNALYVSGAA
jgi:hypothetical protein